jgi:asparagine synthase (glutamine-hydrolysing)
LHAYHVWKDACLDRLSGDFAFAIWDSTQQRLFCARDQFGIVPFYYTEINNGLIFSNNLNCLRLHPQVSDRLNEQAIGDFLLFSMNMDVATTTFADIQKLPPAHTLIWSEGKVRVRRYWQLPEAIEYLRYKHSEEYVEQFRELFERAVADRLRTDRAGTHLSGGMDSTSIAATAYKLMTATGSPVDFRAYTSVYKQVISDEEGDYAARVADALGFPIDYLVVEDYWQQPPIEQPEYIFPEPLLISNQSVEMETNRRAAGHCRVLLAGFGGDPALYPSPSYWYNLLRSGQIRHFMFDVWSCLRFRGLPRLGLRTQLRRWLRRGQQEIDFPDWFNPDFAERVKLKARLTEILTAPPQKDRYGMITTPLWWNIFAGSDPGFTGFPLKVRFPFFDLRLVLYLLSVPPIPWFENKLLLREAMKGVLPDSVRLRSKTPLRGHPRYKFAQQRGVVPWMVELAATPALSSYVNTECLLQKLNAITELTPVSYDQASFALPLAYWLCHQRSPNANRQ